MASLSSHWRLGMPARHLPLLLLFVYFTGSLNAFPLCIGLKPSLVAWISRSPVGMCTLEWTLSPQNLGMWCFFLVSWSRAVPVTSSKCTWNFFVFLLSLCIGSWKEIHNVNPYTLISKWERHANTASHLPSCTFLHFLSSWWDLIVDICYLLLPLVLVLSLCYLWFLSVAFKKRSFPSLVSYIITHDAHLPFQQS